MRKHEHRRDQRGVAKAGKPKARAQPVGPRQRVLRLQRFAGNAAVTELLTPDGVVPQNAGRPLDPALRREMEARLGHDFSAVRLHEDTDAADALGAHAYTVGTDIVFASGKYDEHRLAHELVHVVQQAHGPVDGNEVAPGMTVSDPADHHEREADAVADRVLKSGNASLDGMAATHGNQTDIQRQKDKEEAEPGQRMADKDVPVSSVPPMHSVQMNIQRQESEEDPLDRMNREFEERMRVFATARRHPTIGPQTRGSLKRNPADDWLATQKAMTQSVLSAYGGWGAEAQGRTLEQQRAAAEMGSNISAMAGVNIGAMAQSAARGRTLDPSTFSAESTNKNAKPSDRTAVIPSKPKKPKKRRSERMRKRAKGAEKLRKRKEAKNLQQSGSLKPSSPKKGSGTATKKAEEGVPVEDLIRAKAQAPDVKPKPSSPVSTPGPDARQSEAFASADESHARESTGPDRNGDPREDDAIGTSRSQAEEMHEMEEPQEMVLP